MNRLLAIFLCITMYSFVMEPVSTQRWEYKGGKVDPKNINTDLLEQSVIDFINFKRKKSRRNEIKLNTKLDAIVDYFDEKYAKKDVFKRRRKLRQNFRDKSKEVGYHFSWFKSLYKTELSLPVSGKTYYYDNEIQKFCWGKKGVKGAPVPFQLMTYRQLAKLLVYRSYPASNRRWIHNGDVNKIGIKITIDKNNFPSRIPRVEMLLVVSGNVMPTKL